MSRQPLGPKQWAELRWHRRAPNCTTRALANTTLRSLVARRLMVRSDHSRGSKVVFGRRLPLYAWTLTARGRQLCDVEHPNPELLCRRCGVLYMDSIDDECCSWCRSTLEGSGSIATSGGA